MHNYLRVLSRIANAPLFLSEDKLNILSTNVIIPLLTSGKALEGQATPTNKEINVNNPKLAIIEVFDSLVGKGGAGESGFTSYEGIDKKVKAAIASGVSKIGFYIDSPGGEVGGLFALTDFISNLPSVYGIETFAFTDGSANSAAYAIASATQTIYATSTASLGSIGVIMSLVDVTKMDEKLGATYTILRSKKEKAVYNPHEAVTAEVVNKYTAILDELDTIFNENVVANRNVLSINDIKNMQGNSYLASKAVELKLADKVVANLDEVINLVLSDVNSQPTQKGNVMTLEELKAQLSAKEADLAALQASVTNTVAKAITDERARCSEILIAGSTLKIPVELISKRIIAGSSKEDALDVFTAIAEAKGISTAIDTTTSITATITELPSNVTKLQVAGMEDLTVSGILEAAKASAKGVK